MGDVRPGREVATAGIAEGAITLTAMNRRRVPVRTDHKTLRTDRNSCCVCNDAFNSESSPANAKDQWRRTPKVGIHP